MNSLYVNFVIDCTRGYFLSKTDQILGDKALGMKVKRIVIFLAPKSLKIYFVRNFQLFHFDVKISEKFHLLFTLEFCHYAIWYKDKCIK